MFKLIKSLQLLVLVVGFWYPTVGAGSQESQRNDRPIIGILSQERENDVSVSYIAASYVQHMESSGARVVPILMNQDEFYYKKIVNETNGLLLPGGGVNIMDSNFQRAARILFRFITEANDRGERYPIYGVCQGFEMATVLVVEQWVNNPNSDWLTDCSAEDISLNLKFLDDPHSSRFFKDAEHSIIKTLENENATSNFHTKCLTMTNFTASGLHKHLRVLSTTNDTQGFEFVSTMESLNKSRPIYLVQWHPEKSIFEFKIVDGEQLSVSHTPEAIKMVQYVGNFIVEESRKNLNHFATNGEEERALIFNCNPLYTMSTGERHLFERDHFNQLYLFSAANGCDSYAVVAPILINYRISITGVLAFLVGILIGVTLTRWSCTRKTGYTKIGGNV